MSCPRLLAILIAQALACTALFCGSAVARSQGYTDPRLLDVPWGNYSFIRQGWRGYLETVPAARYRDGLGVVWGRTPPHRSADEIATMLAWAGFRRVRLEIPWGSVRWDETGFEEATEQRMAQILGALRAHGLRPLILLNANHLQPCPVQWRELTVQGPAAAGEYTVAVTGDLIGLSTASNPTIMSLADGTHAGPLIVSYVPGERTIHGDTYVLRLSKPLAHALRPRDTLRVAILRYPPLYPVGTTQFEATAAGWLRYVELTARLVDKAYGEDAYDVEIWNELTFGSAYLDIDNYREPQTARQVPDFLHPGGNAWELASRTVQWLKHTHPRTQVIWGFSNTSFFHTRISELPQRLDGQSYHPYGTGRRCYADLVRGKRELLLDSYVPSGCVVQPEGYAHAWQQTESLLRLIAPSARSAHPPASTSFQHFITEHGFSPAEMGITTLAEAQHAKQSFLLRAPLLWLNKGLSALYIYDLYEPDETGLGLLRSDGSVSPALSALHRLTSEFAGPKELAHSRQLSLEIAREGVPTGILPGDADGLHLRQEEAAAFLPFQTDDNRFVIAAYVMTQDFPTPLAPQPYRVTISGLDGRNATVKYYAPDAGSAQPVTTIASTAGSVTLRLSLTEIPRLIEIRESTGPQGRGAT